MDYFPKYDFSKKEPESTCKHRGLVRKISSFELVLEVGRGVGGCPGFTDQNGKFYGTFLLLYGRDKRSKTSFPIGYKVWAASLLI